MIAFEAERLVWLIVAEVSAGSHGSIAFWPVEREKAWQRRGAHLGAGREKRAIERLEGAWPRLGLWLRW